MSPDARLIAAAILRTVRYDGTRWNVDEAAEIVADLEKSLAALPEPEPAPGIRGMVPVAYLKDILEGIVARLSIADRMTGYDETLDYAKRRLADVEAL